ncbi:Ribosomal protein L10e, partial [mine drainage metagenome]
TRTGPARSPVPGGRGPGTPVPRRRKHFNGPPVPAATMTRKPARMYRKIEGQIYTRREYMGGVPACRITQFDTGNLKDAFPVQLSLGMEEAGQVRDIALEAARISAVRVMDRTAPNQFHLKMRRYPHAILREHKMATGAGADRISDGMRRAFGKPVGHAVRAGIGSEILTIYTTLAHVDDAKEALRKASHKLPVPTRVIISQRAS